ncbi:hypothetical protein PPH41_44250, partial [Burkholderia gladioli]|nr:hypothetical protein [Burkholderia gladioli]
PDKWIVSVTFAAPTQAASAAGYGCSINSPASLPEWPGLDRCTPALQPLVDAPPRPIDATTKADKGARPARRR